MSWTFYSNEGKLLYDVAVSSAGDADTLDGVDSTGYVRIGSPGLNTGDVNVSGHFTLPLAGTSSNLDLATGTYRTVLVDSTSSAVSITLPTSPLVGEIYEVRDTGNAGAGNASVHNITIVRGNLSHAIDGNTSDLTISEDGKGLTLVFDGTGWVTLADRLNVASINAATLDGLDSTQFLRSDIADIASGSISFSEVSTFFKSIYSPVDAVTTDTTLDDTYRTVLVDPNGTPKTITLPASPLAGQWYEIKDVGGGGSGDAETNPISISGNGALIDGSISDFVLNANGNSVVIVSDGTDWFTIALIDNAIPAPALDDLSNVTAPSPVDGATLRYDSGSSQWEDTGDITAGGAGRLHLNVAASSAGIAFGESAGSGNKATVTWKDNNTLELSNRVMVNGTLNNRVTYLEHGVLPSSGSTYELSLPYDNVLLCNTNSGDVLVRLPSTLNAVTPKDGDSVTLKDITGSASVNNLAFIGEGVSKRNVPLLTLASVTGTIAGAPTTVTPGGVGVNEEQNILVTGTGTFELTFDGVTTSATLTETSTALDVENAINALSPHVNYGSFSVSCSGTDVSTGGGVSVIFDGGAEIDGESSYYLAVPYEVSKAIYYSGNWFLI